MGLGLACWPGGLGSSDIGVETTVKTKQQPFPAPGPGLAASSHLVIERLKEGALPKVGVRPCLVPGLEVECHPNSPEI